jgi:glycosyltransferase involved in cell wall biosynthesis
LILYANRSSPESFEDQTINVAEMKKISGIIISLNEERRIAEAIQSLRKICNEVIVVDSGSQDRTVTVAEREGARTVVQPYLGDGLQKNFGHRLASNDWVFSLDADEILSSEAVDLILKLDLDKTPFEGFAFRRRNHIGSRWIKVCGWYPDYLTRLYQHRKTGYEPVREHAKVLSKNIQRVKVDLLHFSYHNSGELFTKATRFSSRGAKIMLHKNKRAYFFSPFVHGFGAFTKKYVWKIGFLGGVDGFTVSLSAAIHSYLKYSRLLEMRRDPAVREKLNDSIW